MAAPARSEIPNWSNVLIAAKTLVTTGSPVSNQPAQLLSWHQARGHGAALCHYRCDCGEDSMKYQEVMEAWEDKIGDRKVNGRQQKKSHNRRTHKLGKRTWL
ncbi:hypothetical protein AVEN_112397-1 [Araneus ventricosus]|uniref:Uncharacterized protein n=1 Tax=Araneus ventricosus TaxID=182803 RepID=A0A4Y2VK23_ARAVE|nr:hypothetical protein AVEN_112397-1 [Araneus ventricosus]